MATKIPYLDETWNPVVGCSHISPGCDNCWAEKMSCRLAYMETGPYHEIVKGVCDRYDENGATPDYDGWNGKTSLVESALDKPLHWKKPRNIGVSFMGDLFHDSVEQKWIDMVFAVMTMRPQHNFLLLTKRINNARDYFKQHIVPENVWLGVSVCEQSEAWKVNTLRSTYAPHRWVSFEPLLESIYLQLPLDHKIDWAVVGAESGPQRRYIPLSQLVQTVVLCKKYLIKTYVKQIHLDGKLVTDVTQFPKALQYREPPKELNHGQDTSPYSYGTGPSVHVPL